MYPVDQIMLLGDFVFCSVLLFSSDQSVKCPYYLLLFSLLRNKAEQPSVFNWTISLPSLLPTHFNELTCKIHFHILSRVILKTVNYITLLLYLKHSMASIVLMAKCSQLALICQAFWPGAACTPHLYLVLLFLPPHMLYFHALSVLKTAHLCLPPWWLYFSYVWKILSQTLYRLFLNSSCPPCVCHLLRMHLQSMLTNHPSSTRFFQRICLKVKWPFVRSFIICLPYGTEEEACPHFFIVGSWNRAWHTAREIYPHLLLHMWKVNLENKIYLHRKTHMSAKKKKKKTTSPQMEVYIVCIALCTELLFFTWYFQMEKQTHKKTYINGLFNSWCETLYSIS